MNPAPGYSTIPRVLSISEILRDVFLDLDYSSCAAAARVCKTWVDVALDILWEELESPFPIMRLLGPITLTDFGWDWETAFPEKEWARFASYTARVRSLSYDGKLYNEEGLFGRSRLAPAVSAKLLYYVATNPSRGGYLLPQNQKIRWRVATDNDLQTIIPFVSPALKNVSIETEWEVTNAETARLLRTLHAILPDDILSLQLLPNGDTSNDATRELEAALGAIITSRASLQALHVPGCPYLDVVYSSELRSLDVSFPLEWKDKAEEFFAQLSERCGRLEDLRLVVEGQCLDLEVKEIQEMGKAWPTLEALHVSSRRFLRAENDHAHDKAVARLITLAQAFSPGLRKLAIHLTGLDTSASPNLGVCFKELKFFSVGNSPCNYRGKALGHVTDLLAALLPPWIDYVYSDALGMSLYSSVFEAEQRIGSIPDWDIVSEKIYATVPRALAISEILRDVFLDLDSSSCATAARVCQTWVDVALDVLWEVLESPFPIMRLLGPMTLTDVGWDWETGFPEKEWTRFASYTARVRSVSYDGQINDENSLFHRNLLAPDVPAKLLYYVAANGGGYLLPQNQEIAWLAATDKDLQTIIPFISPNLKHVSIEAEWEVTNQETARLLRTLHGILPRELISLQLVPSGQTSSEVTGEMEIALDTLIMSRERLQALQIPCCPHLDTMYPPLLQSLEVNLPVTWMNDPEGFLVQLSQRCPHLEDLRLVVEETAMLTFQAIRPLFRCSLMRSLDIDYLAGLDLQAKEIQELGRTWPTLETLHISSRRFPHTESNQAQDDDVARLTALAQAFSPGLRKLAIHLTALDPVTLPNPCVRFPNLELFSVGTSPFGYSGIALARARDLLAAILPPSIDLIHSNGSGIHLYPSVFVPDTETIPMIGEASWHWGLLSGLLRIQAPSEAA
ncbi:hypothetical protein FRB90_003217 [Tulasnella sp. 427]|nr:hypothetical protein FRB90_003217 [Tulasnella sp. 427]